MNNRITSQTDKVFLYIAAHGKIDAMEALKHCGTMRLSALIFNLRHRGVNIRTDRSKGYGVYYLVAKGDE